MNTFIQTIAAAATITAVSVLPAHAQSAKRPPAVAKVTVPGATQEPASGTTTSGTTIYKHVDERGHVTYSNRPMKGAEVVELEPITVIPSGPLPTSLNQASNQPSNFRIQAQQPALAANTAPTGAPSNGTVALAAAVSAAAGLNGGNASGANPQVAMVQPIPTNVLPNVETSLQKARDDGRRKILEDEMKAEQKLLADAVLALSATEADRTVIEQMRLAAAKQTPSAYAEARRNYEAREEKLRTLQESVNLHEKNVTALKKELSALR